MSQLIALIIAIALGAIVTAIGFVFLGDAFTKNSERGVALQFISQASQVEMALTAHRAEKAKSAFPETISDGLAQWNSTSTTLTNLSYLKDLVSAPKGSYNLLQDANKNVYLVASSVDISANVCKEIEKLAGRDDVLETLTAATQAVVDTATTGVAAVLGAKTYGCFTDGSATPVHSFVYEVE